MLPVLLDLKFIKIYTFGVFLVLALFWSAFLLWKNIRLTSYKEEEVFDGLFVSLGMGLFIGRLVYVFLNFEKFGFDILKFILINGYPGLSLYGCLVGAFFGLYLYLLTKKIKFNDMVDYFISPALLALGIGKIGSFFSGVEVGTKTNIFLALKYPGFDGMRHLTALYEGVLFLIAAFFAHKLLFEVRRQKYTKGFSFYFFCWSVSVVYFLLDPLKSAHLTFITKDSINRTVSLAILLTFSFYFLYYFRDLIFKNMVTIKNFSLDYGQKTFHNIRTTAGKKITRRKNQDTATDSGA